MPAAPDFAPGPVLRHGSWGASGGGVLAPSEEVSSWNAGPEAADAAPW